MPLFPHPLARRQAERAIAGARVVLASTSLFAIWLDPSEPAAYTTLTYSLHSVYVLYSAVLAGFVWRRSIANTPALVTHVSDIAAFSVFQYLTLGPSSPFFVYFVFSLFCGALRWGWKGTLGTAGAVVASYLVLGVSMGRTLPESRFELNRFIIRTAYLTVTAGLLAYLGRYEARLREEFERLARWPTGNDADIHRAIKRIIVHAGVILGARDVMIAWETDEEPPVHVATTSADDSPVMRYPPDQSTPLVSPELEDRTFLLPASSDNRSTVLISTEDGRLIEGQSPGIHPALAPQLKSGLVSAPFRTDRVSGRAFFTDVSELTAEIIPLAEVVAREIGASLDQLHVTEQLRAIAASEERIRVARDLHDGVLQSLTGIRLELRSVASELEAGSSTARDRLFAIERALAIEQRELRFFIADLRPGGERPPQDERGPSTLAGRLEAVQERIAAEWKVPVTIRVIEDPVLLSARIVEAVPLMVHEAIVNALKHAQPSRVAVSVQSDSGAVRIVVSDDGHGFPFRGRYDHDALARSPSAPVSLLQRVAALGGRLSIDSSDTGSRVEMLLTV